RVQRGQRRGHAQAAGTRPLRSLKHAGARVPRGRAGGAARRVGTGRRAVMGISTGVGLLAGAVVLCTLMLMGGDLRMFVDVHAAIVIFGGSFAATLIRFPLGSIFHGLPLGARYAFTLRRMSQRDLVDEIAGLAEIARKQGPIG